MMLNKNFSTPKTASKTDQESARRAISLLNDYTTNEEPDIVVSRTAYNHLLDYAQLTLQKIRFRYESRTLWPISSESIDAMLNELNVSSQTGKTVKMRVVLEFLRSGEDGEKPTPKRGDWEIDIKPNSTLSTSLQRAIRQPGTPVRLIVNDRITSIMLQFEVQHALPYYVVVQNTKPVEDAEVLLQSLFESNETSTVQDFYSSLNFSLSVFEPVNLILQ